MLLKLSAVRAALFFWTTQVLDLDTGEIDSLNAMEIEGRTIKNSRLMPLYSTAPIYQQYFALVQKRFGFEIPKELLAYPNFKFVPIMNCNNIVYATSKEEHEFIDKAYMFCEENDLRIEADRLRKTSEYDPSFPAFEEYCIEFELEFVKNWCESQGYDWYA